MQRLSHSAVVDSVASGLVSSVIVAGTIVFAMLMMWFSARSSEQNAGFSAMVLAESGRGDHPVGWEKDILQPGSEDAEKLAEPSAEHHVQLISLASSEIESSFVSSNAEGNATFGPQGSGDRRLSGPLGEGDDVVPMHQRWELRFQAGSLGQYAQQLDQLGIELACVGGSPDIEYATSLSKSPQKRIGAAQEANQLQRVFFAWRSDNPLKRFDEQLLSQAKIKTEGRLILKFCSQDLKERLLKLERDALQSKGYDSVKQIARTVFETRPSANGFELAVVEQYYR